MGHAVFQPRTAVREEKRQVNEALGRSFCKTLAEPITNSDSSAKRKLNIPQASGLVDLMLSVPKGTQMDTNALCERLVGVHPRRVIVVEVVAAKSHGRQVGEVVVIDEAEGMSAACLREALEDIAGDRATQARGMPGRNLFGRGLSDVMRAHAVQGYPKSMQPVVQTYDGTQLTVAQGEWRNAWTIDMTDEDNPAKVSFDKTFLNPASTGTAIRFVISDRARDQGCRIPQEAEILWRLANFYMLRLIASDPNVELILRQYRATATVQNHIRYGFPIGQVIEAFSCTFDPAKHGLAFDPMQADFVIVRADSERPLAGARPDRDRRERGVLIVDDLDAAYDLTFVDTDYENADYLSRIYGVIRVSGLHNVLEKYLNADTPSSPLRPDRDGFNREHEFAKAMLDFLAENLRPIYEKESRIAEEKNRGDLSKESKKRIDDALKHLNKYFQQITELSGGGIGVPDVVLPKPTASVVFFPEHTRLVAGHPRHVLLLVREDVVRSRAEVMMTASDGISVEPETMRIEKKECPRWSPHQEFFALQFSVSATLVGQKGHVDAMVEGKDGEALETQLQIDDVLAEPMIAVPETLEFRPSESTGRPNRRNNLVLLVNPAVVSAGHYVRIQIARRTGDVLLIAPNGDRCEELDVKLDADQHRVRGQDVFRVLIPWRGTGWGQRAQVLASVRVGSEKLTAAARIRLDESEAGGFFKKVKYDDLGEETLAPSRLQPGEIVINARDRLNQGVFGDGQTPEELQKSFGCNRFSAYAEVVSCEGFA